MLTTKCAGVFFNVYLSGLPSESLGPFCESLLRCLYLYPQSSNTAYVVYHIHDRKSSSPGQLFLIGTASRVARLVAGLQHLEDLFHDSVSIPKKKC